MTQDQPQPGACGDPGCPVLHADPANPIHPSMELLMARKIDRLEAENERLRAIEAAARDVLDAYDQQDDEMDWTAPAVDMILRRALTEGRHYAT